jgi:hypothetical protein
MTSPNDAKANKPNKAMGRKRKDAKDVTAEKGKAASAPLSESVSSSDIVSSRALNSNESVSIKKLFPKRSETAIVIELLSDSQEALRPPNGAIRVWVQQLMNPEEVNEVKRSHLTLN